MSAIFTKQRLIDVDACQPQVDLFAETFGDSVKVTVARARKVAYLFDWDFAARFLDNEGRAEYKRGKELAFAEYQRVTGPVLAEYQRVTELALSECQRVTELALSECRSECQRVRESAFAEFQRLKGSSWAKAYIATCARRRVAATSPRVM